jgi:hypothetical protein
MDVTVNDQDELTMRILEGTVVCNDLEVIDACRGTGIGTIYNQRYEPFDGECKQNRGSFQEGLPIYRSLSGKVFMYAIDRYPDDWSKEELRGLHRWRIASFQSFTDTTSCRIEQANINQIDFAALGQPYNFFPTIACFDRNGESTAGFKSSTINLRCNDFNVIGGGNNIPIDDTGDEDAIVRDTGGGGGDERSGGAKFGIALAILLVLAGLAYGGFLFYKKKRGIDAAGSSDFSEDLESGKQPLHDKNKLPDAVLEREAKMDSQEQARKEEFQFLSRQCEKSKPPEETAPELPTAAAVLEKDIKENNKDEKSQLPPAFQFLSRPKITKPESAPPKKVVVPQKIVKEDKKEEAPQMPPAFQFLSRPKSTVPVAAPIVKASTRRESIDPPVVGMSNHEEDDDDDDDDYAIPSSIKNMVSELDSFFDDDDDKPSGINKPSKKPAPRQRSLSPSPASKYYDTKGQAAPLNTKQSIDPSEQILKTRPGMGSRNRSFTPSNANNFDKKQANTSRPRSLSPSPASKYGKKSATPEPQVKLSPTRRISPTRSRSLEPSNAGKYEKRRPRSLERTPDVKKLSNPRDRSLERTPGTRSHPRVRTRSLEPAPDPKKLSRTKSFEPTPEPKHLPTASAGRGTRFDASKLNSQIIMNDDGSVSVIERKTREDGAIVRSKTTYSDKRVAAKYGYDV